ncbi:MAG: glycosyltransferase family 4 protein [Spirochaetes bacterium]|nr:glycosyltransferase family 4 protein [Spirochaetota bacterium]
MRILFITRKYPPIKGGMEKYSKELYEALSCKADVTLCANRRGNRVLPIFLATAAWRIIRDGRHYDVIHLGDGLLSVLIPVIRAFTRAAVTITVHGLDVTYGHPLYRLAVVPRLRDADRVICISRNTRKLCIEKGIPDERITVIPNGIDLEDVAARPAERPVALPGAAKDAKILCTVGRLVRRKGHEWFIRNVLPKLDDSYVYLMAGDGPERENLRLAIAETGSGGKVFLLGTVDEGTKEWLLRVSRLFIMPNVPVRGDVEGFGLVLTEAASRGLMAIASELDGIPDAVIPGETGVLVPPGDADAFAAAIEAASPDRRRVETAAAIFAWDRIADIYIREMQESVAAAASRRKRP